MNSPRPRPRLLALASSGAFLVLAGCSFAPGPEVPDPVSAIPSEYAEADSNGDYEPLEWWRAFQDPTLNRILDTALVANLDLTEAVARVQEVRALLGVASADLLPTLDGSVDGSRQSNPTNAGFGAQISSILGSDSTNTGDEEPRRTFDRFTIENFSASLGFAYELDVWGRARNDRGAAVADLFATESDLHAVRLGVLAETTTAYFDVTDLRARVDLTSEIVDVLEERVTLTETRYDLGLVNSFELYQVRQDLQNTRASLPQLRTQLADARRRLALLLGRYPGELDRLLDAPAPRVSAEAVPIGVPADLLWQRPDVRAAAQRLEASRLRVGARRADLLPRLTLTGSLGLQSPDADGLVDLSQWFSNLATGLTAPLFQGGRLRANLAGERARYEQQTAAYGRIVLTAVGEAELALLRFREETTRFAYLSSQLQEAESSVALQSERYGAGIAEYPDFLDALRNRLNVEATLSGASRDLALARLGVHRAFGGTWTQPAEDSEAPDPRSPETALSSSSRPVEEHP